MTVFNSAYDTSACSGYRHGIDEIEEKLKIGQINSSFNIVNIKLSNYEDSFNICLVEGGNTTADVIPYFSHPIFNHENKHKEVENIFIDVRNFGKWYAPQQKFVVRNNPEYSWHILRGVLNHVWVNEKADVLRDISIIPASVYSSLISECLARKYALDPGEQAIAAVVACYFYYCLFTDDKTFGEYDLNKVAGNIARATKVPAAKVFEVIEEMPVLHTLEEMCVAMKEKTQSIRLDDFNIGVLIAITSGNWFGTNAKENLAVGLEHIPTWLMICYAALNENTFKRSVLAKLVDRFAKGGAGENFIRSMDSILDTKKLFINISQ